MNPTIDQIAAFKAEIDQNQKSIKDLKAALETQLKGVKGEQLFYRDTEVDHPLFATRIRITDAINALEVLNEQYSILWSHLMAEMFKK